MFEGQKAVDAAVMAIPSPFLRHSLGPAALSWSGEGVVEDTHPRLAGMTIAGAY